MFVFALLTALQSISKQVAVRRTMYAVQLLTVNVEGPGRLPQQNRTGVGFEAGFL